MLSVLGVVAILSTQFDPKALGSARESFPPCSESIRATEMGSGVELFPIGRSDVRYTFGHDPDGAYLLIRESLVKGKMHRDWRLVLRKGRSKSGGSLSYYLSSEGYRPKSKLTAAMARDLRSTIPLAGYFFQPMGDQAMYWAVTPSAVTKETRVSWDADSRKHTPFPVGADEIRLIGKARPK